jgi:undecaprenyl phosphate N,N'-diacetylbacillosamine 1-phosphate transferase
MKQSRNTRVRSRWYGPVKRTLDIVLSGAGLVILSPVCVVVALLVRSRLGSPVLFTQNRPGRNARIFRLYKFRTMTSETDLAGKLLPDAVRLTSFGKWLRATSLDELPELWNVLRGDMSIVGPRPLHVHYLPRYSSEQARRHDVRPGVTGLAQVSGRNALSWDDRFALDVEYVDSLNLRTDLQIIARTIRTVLRRDGISADGHVTMSEFTGPNPGDGNVRAPHGPDPSDSHVRHSIEPE